MKNRILLAMVALAVVALLGSTSALADGHLATAYVVHGINGEDFGMDRELPVDVYVSDVGCAIPGFKFGDRIGPVPVPTGNYDITISLADMDNPCEGTAVIALSGVKLEGNATIIAHRTADGSPGPGDLLELGVTASLFANDFTATGRGNARVLVHHTAKAPSVDVVLSRNYNNPNAPGVMVPGLTNPTADGEAILSQINAEFRPGNWTVVLEIGGAPVFGPDRLWLRPFTATYIYAVGEFPTTFQYLIYRERGLKDRRPRPTPARDPVRAFR
jgi:hypothetical protein